MQKHRCECEHNDAYVNYGARGIKCIWTLEEACMWYDENPRPSKDYSIDRIDNDGNYESSNVKWSNKFEQVQNTRLHKTNTSGIRGIYQYGDKFRVKKTINGIKISKAGFVAIEEAEKWLNVQLI